MKYVEPGLASNTAADSRVPASSLHVTSTRVLRLEPVQTDTIVS
jgi:hypothetical protein